MPKIVKASIAYIFSNGADILTAILILILGILLARVLANLAQKAMLNSKAHRTLAVFVGKVTYYTIIVFVALVFLEKIGVKTIPFIALIGAAGFAIALGAQGVLANFAAGLIIIIFGMFEIGDDIESNGASGKVEEIQMFSTTLITADNKRKIIPNAKIIAEILTVNKK